MVIQIDSREHKWELARIQRQLTAAGCKTIVSKLYVGDYQSLDNPRLVIDRKKDLQELCGNVCQQHERFQKELRRAIDAEIQIIILCEHGEEISDWFVSVLVSEMGLKSLRSTSKKEYITYKHRNILRQHFTVNKPNAIWGSDVTFLNYNIQPYYICVVLDLFSRMVVSYRISKHNSTHLTKSTILNVNPAHTATAVRTLCYTSPLTAHGECPIK